MFLQLKKKKTETAGARSLSQRRPSELTAASPTLYFSLVQARPPFPSMSFFLSFFLPLSFPLPPPLWPVHESIASPGFQGTGICFFYACGKIAAHVS